MELNVQILNIVTTMGILALIIVASWVLSWYFLGWRITHLKKKADDDTAKIKSDLEKTWF